MKVLFQIGPFAIYFFGFMIMIGAIVGMFVLKREAKRAGYNSEVILEGVVYALISGIIGARIFYIIFYNPVYYLNNPAEIFAIHQGGLSIHGGLVGGFLAAFWFLKKHKLSFLAVADLASPPLILAQAIARTGCDVFGKPMITPLPWGIIKDGVLVHPAQVYEFILNYLLFFYLWLRKGKIKYSGQLFGEYLIGYSLARGIVEFFRINPVIYPPFSISHLLSLGGILLGILVILVSRKYKPSLNNVENKSYWGTALLSTIILTTLSIIIYYTVQG
ncbi:prolipoprotein diacylglyceryl transferase [Zhaonella formicivorans]|uniref:prolipoprotein diacylglyceryl transferase n=1 Tax=Zhaonella formicivorans TaxID=2528593 RepID=UPI0010DFD916|nr:prolipoprotein diacylglyceryl transferase [Zhaonella formicivorans]